MQSHETDLAPIRAQKKAPDGTPLGLVSILCRLCGLRPTSAEPVILNEAQRSEGSGLSTEEVPHFQAIPARRDSPPAQDYEVLSCENFS